MNWFLLTLATIILWGITDVLYKASWDYEDPLAHYKTFVWIGIVMALVGCIMTSWSDTLADSMKITVQENLYLMPLTIIYAITRLFGLLGTKYLDASVFSPLENIDSAMTTIIIYFYFLFTGRGTATNSIGVLDIISTVIIMIGVILVGIQEQKIFKQGANLGEGKKKRRLGAIALLFPIIYNLVDAASMAAVSVTVSGEAEAIIPDIDFFIFECLGFALVAIGIWFYMLIVKKYAYNPFQESELVRCGAATGETFGTMTFIIAAGINPMFTAPVTSSYCLVTLVLARIFLKERLTKKQYLSVIFLIIGIALFGISEIFNV